MEITVKKSSFHNTITIWLMLSTGLVVLFFFNTNGGLTNGLRADAPDGQFLYLLSKSMGLTALFLLWWQLFSALISSSGFLSKARLSVIKPGKVTHIVFGSLLLVLMLSHASLFISAVSLRQDLLAIHLLVPNFSGFYSASLSLGVIALFLILLAVCLAATRKYIQRLWMYGHQLVLLAFGLAALHAVLIGSEASSGMLLYFLIFFLSTISFLVMSSVWQRLSNARSAS